MHAYKLFEMLFTVSRLNWILMKYLNQQKDCISNFIKIASQKSIESN